MFVVKQELETAYRHENESRDKEIERKFEHRSLKMGGVEVSILCIVGSIFKVRNIHSVDD